MRRRREELGLTRQQLADKLGVSVSAVGNYETGVSAPKEGVLLRLFDALDADPNYLYWGSYRAAASHSDEEHRLLAKYRQLPLSGRQTVCTLVAALREMTDDLSAAASWARIARSPSIPPLPPPALPRRYSARTTSCCPSPATCPPARSWPSAYRATPCPPPSATARWST